MNRYMKYSLTILLIVLLSGCSLFNDVKEEVKDDMDKVEDKVDSSMQSNRSLKDLMTYLKDNGITYEDETTLEDFDFSAKEGKSFTYDGNKIYVYSVDQENAAVRALMNQAITNKKINANRNGKTEEYGARANGDYLMIYELEAKVDDLLKRFEAYNKSSAN